MGLLALALADNAFKEPGMDMPRGPFLARDPSLQRIPAIQWRPEIMETPPSEWRYMQLFPTGILGLQL